MAKTKYDFIKELLEVKKINQDQRGRILELASREISLEGTLEERVQKIEEIIFRENQPEITLGNSDISPTNVNNLPKYLDPSDLYNFLFEFNQNPVLRYTCHDIDSEALIGINNLCNSETYNFNKHLKLIIKEFEKHVSKFYAPKVVPLIRGYLTGIDYYGNKLEKGWATDNILVNWSSPELLLWAEKNLNVPPSFNESLAGNQEIELFPIDPQINSPITCDPIQNFTQLVLHFKNLFHVKSGKQSLREILKRINSYKKWNDQIDFEIDNQHFPDNLEHFTSVDKLTEAYNKLLKLIIEHHQNEEKPLIKISFFENAQTLYLSVHHINGVYRKSIQNTLERPGEQFNLLVNHQINGLCNLILRADFGNNKYATINLWNGKIREAIELDNFQGVEHLLEFPKNKEL
jgi:hypothetical protein